jgi:hypothetical protein
MKYSLILCILPTMICHINLASDEPHDEQLKRITRGIDLQSLSYCQADYTVEATSYTKQPLSEAILHLNKFYQNPSSEDMQVKNMRIRCKRGKIPFRTTVVKTDKPLALEYAINIMNAIKENEVSK